MSMPELDIGTPVTHQCLCILVHLYFNRDGGSVQSRSRCEDTVEGLDAPFCDDCYEEKHDQRPDFLAMRDRTPEERT